MFEFPERLTRSHLGFMAGAALWLCSVPAGAQESPKITVTEVGELTLIPTALEATLPIRGKGANAKAAVQAVQATRTKILGKLAELGATASAPQEEACTVLAQPQTAARPSAGRLKKAGGKEEAKVPEVEMLLNLRVRMPLKGKDLPTVLFEAEDLKTKTLAIHSAEQPKSPGQSEKEEEKQVGGAAFIMKDGDIVVPPEILAKAALSDHFETITDMDDSSDDDDSAPSRNRKGAVRFFFFAKMSEAQRAQAFTETLSKARASAARAAHVLGKGGVEVFSIHFDTDGENPTGLDFAQMEEDEDEAPGPAKTNADDEVASDTPVLVHTTSLTVEFIVK